MIRTLTRHFRKDEQGAAALEFALLLPLFLVIYICVIEFTQAFMVQRRAHHSAAMMADIVAQANTVTKAQLNDFFAVGGLIMAPYSSTPLEGRVTSVVLNAKNEPRVQWSYGNAMSPLQKDTLVTVPSDILEKDGDSLIMAETVYVYDSPFDIAVPGFSDFLSGQTTFRRTFYLRPREVASISCTDCYK
ncbi:TadE/TadG family type IV pilus assembly protein [uncultured Brevundimonas sp.]|uniref:TadE/TadG family type IV pilus assembly protein n=1 Tax=uncultured Brevundimonas sp. TaxID=213418 RepID=UPI00260256BF|nr:TadE/TadG family type IV pilus assembly protein [uncultured Brevundimonas sp.]